MNSAAVRVRDLCVLDISVQINSCLTSSKRFVKHFCQLSSAAVGRYNLTITNSVNGLKPLRRAATAARMAAARLSLFFLTHFALVKKVTYSIMYYLYILITTTIRLRGAVPTECWTLLVSLWVRGSQRVRIKSEQKKFSAVGTSITVGKCKWSDRL